MNQKQDLPETSADPAMTADGAARRRLLRGGLGAAPLVLSVASRPVMAGTCTTASAYGSINGSRPVKSTSCSGRTPDYWKGNPASWPSGFRAVAAGTTAPATLFNDVFPAGGYPGVTLLAVLSMTGTDKTTAMARFCAAAVLNAAATLTPATVLSAQTAKDVWAAHRSPGGYYEPTAGIRWYADYSTPSGSGSMLAWLASTMVA
jgi:hypothetical protein